MKQYWDTPKFAERSPNTRQGDELFGEDDSAINQTPEIDI
jgi:hypothetical protein